MKKLIFLFAMVFAVSMAMAQKTIWITQAGNSNTANLVQSDLLNGGFQQNAIYAVQSGNFNALNSDQSGKQNYIELTQTGTSNVAMMEQLGYDVSAAPGVVNTADIHQGGVSNAANLLQREDATPTAANMNYDTNVAHAQQTGTGGSYILTQGVVTWLPTNSQDLLQSGNSNSATIAQTGQTSLSQINQSGNFNAAYLDQNGQSGMGASSWVNSISSQTGTSNLLDVDQFTSRTFATSVQQGVNNTTNIDQLSWDIEQVNSQQNGTGDIINVNQAN